MAPYRFLTKYLARKPLITYCCALALCGLLAVGCGVSREAQKSDTEPQGPAVPEEPAVNEALVALLESNRSELSDVYATQKSEVPAVFLKDAVVRNIGNPNQGYRIQIISTRSIAKADSIANDYRFWADSAFVNYFPKPYVIYQQPYYKVHIGNFQFYDRATKLTQMVKTRYPGAWVVHDRVEPRLVPPDSIRFTVDGGLK